MRLSDFTLHSIKGIDVLQVCKMFSVSTRPKQLQVQKKVF
jgi:hypothetical protein